MPEYAVLDGLFSNLDAGFDGENLCVELLSHGIISNVCPNSRNWTDTSEKYMFYKEMIEINMDLNGNKMD